MNEETLATYNRSAEELAKYFRGIGSRSEDIEIALKLADKSDGKADVLELGCGDGRDAKVIVTRTRSYVGIDYSEGLIKIARKTVPGAELIVVSMLEYDYPVQAYDVVFAFASILHINRTGVKTLLKKVAGSLRTGGIFYISTKVAPAYSESWKEDQFGKRLFYFYNPKIIEELSGKYFMIVHNTASVKGETEWFEMALKKI